MTSVAAKNFLEKHVARRSIHVLGKQKILPDAQIKNLVQELVRNSPSAFNSQTSRVVLLVGKEHDSYWSETVLTAAQKAFGQEAFDAKHKPRVELFSGSYGTVLFYEDQATVQDWQAKMPALKDQFTEWSIVGSGMAQLAVWTGLEAEGYGANLQHYGALTEKTLSEKYEVPSSWKLHAELVFGSPAGEPKEKTYIDDATRFKSFGLE